MRTTIAAIAMLAVSSLVGCGQQQPAAKRQVDEKTDAQAAAAVQPVVEFKSTSCVALLEKYEPFELVTPDLSRAPNFTAMTYILQPQFITKPVDLDHDGSLDVIVVGDEHALGPNSPLTHSAVLLASHTPGLEPSDPSAAGAIASLIRPRSIWLKSISFAALNSGMTLRGRLFESLPYLSYATVEIGSVGGDPVIRGTVTELVPPLDETTGKPIGDAALWDMLFKVAPDWTAEVLCADPIPNHQK